MVKKDDKVPLLGKDEEPCTSRSVMENGKSRKRTPLHVDRQVYRLEDLNEATQYTKPIRNYKSICKEKIKSCSPTSCVLNTVPLLSWLPRYKWRKHFLSDLISGLTVAIMHIPQGMAYAMLGNLPPVAGIYMAFFPVLVYTVFGTSRHVSMGTFAIVCLMTGKVVHQYGSDDSNVNLNGTSIRVLDHGNGTVPYYTNMEVATTVTFAVALIQMGMYVLRLGVITTLLSETLVNGFTCAAAFHVVASQLKDLFGLPVKKRRGYFKVILSAYDAVVTLPDSNRTAFSISLVFMVVMVINSEILKPWLSKRTKIPFPIELTAVVVGTALSYFNNLEVTSGLSVVGPIPIGLPEPALPAFGLLKDIFLDAFVIHIVEYTITISMAFIFAHKCHYEVDANQELLAMSLSNYVGSFFSCMPITASLSRSLIQHQVGGQTQLASVVSCSILLVLLLWAGPLFETLPRCVLASIIVVALKGMLMQCTELKKYWKLSKWDAAVWLVTFTVTAFVDIAFGLLAGVTVSLLSVFIQGYTPYSCLLGNVPSTDLYLDMKRYKGVQEVQGLKIFHYSGGLSFASKSLFRSLLVRKIEFDPVAIFQKRGSGDDSSCSYYDEEELLFKSIVLDFSSLTFIDPSGVDMLRQLLTDFTQLSIDVYISGCSGPVFEMLKKCDRYERKDSKFLIFPTVHDAVLYASETRIKK